MGPNDRTDERDDQKPKVEPEVDHVNGERRQLVTPGNVILAPGIVIFAPGIVIVIIWNLILALWNVILALFLRVFVINQPRKCILY